ncbi:unnamed protein product [Urochloa humidicola]
MDDVVEMLSRGFDFALMDGPTRLMMQQVYSSLPEPPVCTAAPLSAGAAAASGAPDGVDRISRLSSEVLRDIVSRLPAKDAARTTALSKRWRRVWHSTPLVLVDAHLLPIRDTVDEASRFLALYSGSSEVAAAVSSALAAHPGPFGCVYLAGTTMDTHRDEVEQWLQLLAAKGVGELVFVNRTRKMQADLLQLPATIFRCTNLTRLYIGCWKFPETAALQRAAAFPYLRELGLSYIIMEERDLSFLLHRCPVLEKLLIAANLWPVCIRVHCPSLRCVEVCTGIVPEITVVHSSLLERLLLWGVWGFGELTNLSTSIKIGHAPKLRILGFLSPGMHKLQIGNTIIQAGTKASPNTTVPSVQMLGIQLKLGARIEARMVPSFLRCFPILETLYVQSENPDFTLTGLQPCTPGKLNLKFWEQAGPIECIQHHLKKLALRAFRGQRCELDFLKFVAERAQVLEEMVIVLVHGCSPSDRVGTKLRTSMASAKWANRSCKLMVLQCPFDKEGCLKGKCQSHKGSV